MEEMVIILSNFYRLPALAPVYKISIRKKVLEISHGEIQNGFGLGPMTLNLTICHFILS